MKHRNTLTLILLLATLTLAAQSNYSPCYTNNMSKGNTAFSQGRYSEARTYYVNAKQCAGGNPTEAQKKINVCDAKIKAQKEAAEAKRKAEEVAVILETRVVEEITVNGVSFKMIYVEGGTFTMGCPSEQGSECSDDEKPAHSVTLSDFWIGETEVTQALWKAVMGTEPKCDGGWEDKYGRGNAYPVYRVSWNDCQEFIKKLNQLTGKTFRLPTEAEWEYAARGGNKSRGYKYAGSNTIDDVRAGSYQPVKTKMPNELGLYDMCGTVSDWCQDWYDNSYYDYSPSNNPCNNQWHGDIRVYRGGFHTRDNWCRVSYRLPTTLNYTRGFVDIGFRLALSK